MSRIRGKNTKPEMLLRRLLTERGVAYRIHDARFQGNPDVYVPRLRMVVFVDGCFWHGHSCLGGKLPATRTAYWQAKIEGNRRRDRRVDRALRAEGLRVFHLATCDLRRFKAVADKIAREYATTRVRRV